LWMTTGTGATHVGNSGGALTSINGLLYFQAYPDSQSSALYTTDGTTTTLVSDFTGVTVWDNFLDVNNTLYFGAFDVPHGLEPWKLALGGQTPPTANAGGHYAISEGNSLNLDSSSSSDSDGDSLTYSWTINGVANAASGVKPTLTWTQLQAL